MQHIIFINETKLRYSRFGGATWRYNTHRRLLPYGIWSTHFQRVFVCVCVHSYYYIKMNRQNVQIEVVSWKHVETKRFLLNIIRCIFDISSVQHKLYWTAVDNTATKIYIDKIRKQIDGQRQHQKQHPQRQTGENPAMRNDKIGGGKTYDKQNNKQTTTYILIKQGIWH